jgi:hypothetical protein
MIIIPGTIEVSVIFFMFGERFTLEGQPSNRTAWKRKKDSLNSTGVAEHFTTIKNT